MEFCYWSDAAALCEDVYGSFVNWEEAWFICPECGEPIYAGDLDYTGDLDYARCPICEFEFEQEE